MFTFPMLHFCWNVHAFLLLAATATLQIGDMWCMQSSYKHHIHMQNLPFDHNVYILYFVLLSSPDLCDISLLLMEDNIQTFFRYQLLT